MDRKAQKFAFSQLFVVIEKERVRVSDELRILPGPDEEAQAKGVAS